MKLFNLYDLCENSFCTISKLLIDGEEFFFIYIRTKLKYLSYVLRKSRAHLLMIENL